jgi:hypothetical protein
VRRLPDYPRGTLRTPAAVPFAPKREG